MQEIEMGGYEAQHFRYVASGNVATITLNRPERKNPLTLRVVRRAARHCSARSRYANDVQARSCSPARAATSARGGDVHEIIGPLVADGACRDSCCAFTRMTGDLVKAMRACPQPIVAADRRRLRRRRRDPRDGDRPALSARRAARSRSCSSRVGLAGADMGACAILPRIIGQGRASELLYTGRAMTATRPSAGASTTGSCAPEALLGRGARRWRTTLADGPDVRARDDQAMLHQEWNMSIDEAIEAEAQAQAICMQTEDFERAYRAFVAKQKPVFEGN